ncbi:hypothetical protein [Flavobacterium sp. SLB02]|uniref:hypothetical protein n=1 Tax=Flavobacterium sp. SLB02 TaxID=2665645 RepID=UPI0012AA00E0|nr:hypothetical protein [Flavobacterium sp. SLB02]QGK73192.1 hypothetical protein GIY83_03670 [Flavobacterium sp. SLB02]
MNWIQKLIQKAKALFSKSDNENTALLTANKTVKPQVTQNNQKIEELNEIIIGNDKNKVVFNRINDFTLDQGWTPLSPNNENANFFSQLTGAGMASGAVLYSAQGLYQATVNPANLMTYNNGTLSSITLNGKSFGSHAGFVTANTAVFAPILVFQFASMLTGQYYFNGMTKQLTVIQQGINQLLQNHHNERIAKIRAYTEKLIEFDKSSFFTTEDFINIDKIKMELAVIRYEYLLSAHQQLKESLFPEKKGDNAAKYDSPADISSAEKLKIESTILFNEVKREIGSLYKKTGADGVINEIGNFFENSGKKASKMVQKLNESKFFFILEASLHSDKLYQYMQFIELKANLSYKKPDQNRIGKIDQLQQSIYNFDSGKDSVLSEVNRTAESLNQEVTALLNHYNDQSFLNQTEITAKKAEIKKQFQKIDKYKNSNATLIAERIKIKNAFETPIEFIMDNRNGEGKIYVKNLN